jgi:Flp pilus assembly protein protease CpaA
MALLLAFLSGAVITDLRARLIPNPLVLAGAFTGLLAAGLLLVAVPERTRPSVR